MPNHSIANTDLIEDTNWNKKNYYKDQSIVKGTKIWKIIDMLEQSKNLNLHAVTDILTRELTDIQKWIADCLEILDTKENKCTDFKVVDSLYSEGAENPLLSYIYDKMSEFKHDENSCPKLSKISTQFDICELEIYKIFNAMKAIVDWSENAEKLIEAWEDQKLNKYAKKTNK